ncbi:MAG: DUF1127 domain-containing protein [Ferrovibrio sp.]|jgi:uncharacterized protein YjiS (DUF1127 family)|uniref:DUF1127 domain-containing protein n=1 Tax=Ferrovibrio sp. TaxID=1917215 RepID=UPI0039191415
MNTLRNQTAFALPANLAPMSAAEIEAYARRIRAEAIANLIVGTWTALKGAVARVKSYLAQQRAMEELNNLDDIMLRDIGLSRSQIPAAVAGLIERPAPVAHVNENVATAKVTRLVPREAA